MRMSTVRPWIAASVLAFGALGVAGSAGAAAPGVPQTLVHQGRLYGANGVAVNQSLTMQFAIYASENAMVPGWVDQFLVTFVDGYYAVDLGAGMVPFPATLFNGATLWLGITVGSDPEMTPRSPIDSVPYAVLAGNVDGDITPNSVSIPGFGMVINNAGQWVGDPTNLVGKQGPQGPQGPQGEAGSTGPTGPTGPAGANGATGAQGPQGAAGPAGANGQNGLQGAQGAAGTNGAQGAAGANGGANGAQGASGAQGAIGPQGAAGANGAAGTSGTNGAQGAAGAAGTNGTNGALGASGAQGATGTAGTPGAQGATGPQGPAGSGSVTSVSASTPLSVINPTTTPAISLGTVPVGNGGTGDTTLATNGLLYGNGASPVGVTAAGGAGQVLSANGSAVPTWTTGGAAGGLLAWTSAAVPTWITPVSQTIDACTVNMTGQGMTLSTTFTLIACVTGPSLTFTTGAFPGTVLLNVRIGSVTNTNAANIYPVDVQLYDATTSDVLGATQSSAVDPIANTASFSFSFVYNKTSTGVETLEIRAASSVSNFIEFNVYFGPNGDDGITGTMIHMP
jgi:hypothetical protein